MSSTVSKRQHIVKGAEARTPQGEALSLLSFQVLRLSGLLNTVGDTLAQPSGQTSARWQVLAAVEHEPATVAGAARVLGLSRQGVQRVADLLVRDGLAAYEDNPAHKRAKLLRLTPAGEAALHTIQAEQRRWANRVGAVLDEHDLRQAASILGRVGQALAEQEPPKDGASDP